MKLIIFTFISSILYAQSPTAVSVQQLACQGGTVGVYIPVAENTTSTITPLICVQLGTSFTLDKSTNPPTLRVNVITTPVVNYADNERPSGDINGVNINFSIVHLPIANSLLVFRNGLRLLEGEDYTISGTTITFINNAQPRQGDKFVVNYRY